MHPFVRIGRADGHERIERAGDIRDDGGGCGQGGGDGACYFRGCGRRFGGGDRAAAMVWRAVSLRMVRAEEEHEQAIIIAGADVDDVAVPVEHCILDAVHRAIEGDIKEAARGMGNGVLPRCRKALRTRRAAEPIAGVRRHVDGARRLHDRSGIGKHLYEFPLPLRRPAVRPALAGDGNPFVIIGIEAVGVAHGGRGARAGGGGLIGHL